MKQTVIFVMRITAAGGGVACMSLGIAVAGWDYPIADQMVAGATLSTLGLLLIFRAGAEDD